MCYRTYLTNLLTDFLERRRKKKKKKKKRQRSSLLSGSGTCLVCGEPMKFADILTMRNHEMRVQDGIIKLENPVVSNDPTNEISSTIKKGGILYFEQKNQCGTSGDSKSNLVHGHLLKHQPHSIQGQQIFCITHVAEPNANSKLEREITVIGEFRGEYSDLEYSSLFCVFGDASVPAKTRGKGVFGCTALPQLPGTVDFYLSLDGVTPISQILKFEYLLIPTNQELFSKVVGFRLQLRLAHLLFSTTKTFHTLSLNALSFANSLEDAKLHSLITCSKDKDFEYMIKSIEENGISLYQDESWFLKVVLQGKLRDWLFERVDEKCKTGILDPRGQGVIHLLAILGYGFLIQMYSDFGLSLDFRDAKGWTALHWAAFYDRQKTVELLLDKGADPRLVTYPTSEFPKGCTFADIASKNGNGGLVAYLAERELQSKTENISGSLLTDTSHLVDHNSSEEHLSNPASPDDVALSQLHLVM